MSVAKFNEAYLAARDARIAELTDKLKTREWPAAEFDELKKSNPNSNLLKRYGEGVLLSADNTLYQLAYTENYELCKKADAYLNVKKKLDTIVADDRKPEDLLLEFFAAVNKGRLMSSPESPMKFEDIAKLEGTEYWDLIYEFHSISEPGSSDTFPVSVPNDIFKGALVELGQEIEKGSKKTEGSPINEGKAGTSEEKPTSPLTEPSEKIEEPSNSPVSEPGEKKVEAESTLTPSTTSTPAEMPAVENKEEIKNPGTTINVNLEQMQNESKPPEPPAPSPVNEKVETASSQGSPEKIEETKTEQTFTPVDANSVFYGGGDFSVNNKTNVSPINVAEGASSENVSSTSQNSSYLSMFGGVSSSTSVSQQPSNISSTINENSGESTSNVSTSTSENVQTTNTSNTVTSSNSYMDLVSQMMGGSTIPDVPSVPTVSSEMPSIPKSEVSFANSENVSQNKSENSGVNQSTQNNLVEQPAQTQTKTETVQDKTNQSTVSESSTNQPANQSTTVQNNEEVVERLTRLERLLSGPLDVRLV